MTVRQRKLDEADVKRLLAESSGDARAAIAGRVAEDFHAEALSESERELALDIFRALLRDVEVRVRAVLSQQLKKTPHLPHDIALALAQDVEAVALPMLHYSEVLTDEDLVALVRGRSPAKQQAIAGRRRVSPDVSDAVVDCGGEDAVATLLGNAGAEISPASLHAVVARYGDDKRVQECLARRPDLPVTVAERLVAKVSERLRDCLLERPGIAKRVAANAILHARERVVLGLSAGADEADVAALVAQLHDNDRLTPAIILRALCQGDIAFFEAALGRLAGLSLTNARTLVHDSGPLGLPAIYARAKLPPALYPAARAAMHAIGELELDGTPGDRERFARRVMERILTQYDELGMALEADDLEYLLDRLNRMAG